MHVYQLFEFQACYPWTSFSQESNLYMWSTTLGVCLDIFFW